MAFLRVVEVLPPAFRGPKGAPLNVQTERGRFVRGLRGSDRYADLFLLAKVKGPSAFREDPVRVAIALEEGLRAKSAPVVVVRGLGRLQFLSAISTALRAGVGSVMVAWGDDDPADVASRASDFRTLAEAIAEASRVRSAARSEAGVLAPVNVDHLSGRGGISRAKGRVGAGARLLLAQPPTADEATLERHLALLERAGLRGRVLLSVFPFKDSKDVARYERLFGWTLPPALHQAARGGSAALLEMNRAIVRRIREEGLPGVYISTRGEIGLARQILS